MELFKIILLALLFFFGFLIFSAFLCYFVSLELEKRFIDFLKDFEKHNKEVNDCLNKHLKDIYDEKVKKD